MTERINNEMVLVRKFFELPLEKQEKLVGILSQKLLTEDLIRILDQIYLNQI